MKTIGFWNNNKTIQMDCPSFMTKDNACIIGFFNLRLLTHVRFSSKTGSDTFRSVLTHGKKQESRTGKYL